MRTIEAAYAKCMAHLKGPNNMQMSRSIENLTTMLKVLKPDKS